VGGKYSYDVWGRRRNYDNFTYTINSTLSTNYFDRFYTMHETVLPLAGGVSGGWGGLINMNGRLYDPLLARMLSPDNYVQAAGNMQSYNRYSYCVNNPLKYTDPSGDLFFIIPHISFSSGGVNIGVTVGVGLPGGASAQATVGYDFGSNNAYASVGVSVGCVTASVGWGTQTGFTAGIGVGFPLGGGMSTSFTSAGVSWSQNGGFVASAGGISYSQYGGFSCDPSMSYSHSFKFYKDQSSPAKSPDSNDPRYLACKDCPPQIADSKNSFDEKYRIVKDANGNIIEINGTSVYGTKLAGEKSAFTAPGVGIFVDPAVQNDIQLLMHEYGHILQAEKAGMAAYYSVIAPESVKSFWNNPSAHFNSWTEVNANKLAYLHFQGGGPYGWSKYHPIK
jgi:RHS repeat-associated protein